MKILKMLMLFFVFVLCGCNDYNYLRCKNKVYYRLTEFNVENSLVTHTSYYKTKKECLENKSTAFNVNTCENIKYLCE